MRDSNYIREDGTRVPVSNLSDEELSDLLNSNLRILVSDGNENELEWLEERLKIEVVIRSIKDTI